MIEFRQSSGFRDNAFENLVYILTISRVHEGSRDEICLYSPRKNSFKLFLMKQNFFRAVLFASILLVSASCNDDDDNNGPPPGPAATFIADQINPADGQTIEWSASSISATESLFGELSIKAVSGSDTLSILVSSVEEGVYAISPTDLLAYGNYYVSFSSSDTSFYTFSSDPEEPSGGLLTITQTDTVSNTFNADYQIAFYNEADSADFFILNNGVMENVPYSTEEFDFGSLGDGSISFSANGQSYNLSNGSGVASDGSIELSAIAPTLAPAAELIMNDDITVGTYNIGAEGDPISASVTIENFFDGYNSTSGTLVVTTHDTQNKNIVGTFSFTGESAFDPSETVEITNGSFDFDYD